MKYIETTVEQLTAIEGDASIVPAPDESDTECIRIGDEYFVPFIAWMRFDPESRSWLELDPADEEEKLNRLSESSRFQEVSQKEAGEKFSDDVNFVE